MKNARWNYLLATAATLVMSGAALADGGPHPEGAPAPIAGLGIGALAAMGYGYRALKRRLNR